MGSLTDVFDTDALRAFVERTTASLIEGGFDKEDIMTLAKKIGTFETSILPYEACCTVFLPKSPAIKPRLAVVEKAEQAMWEVGEELMKKAIENVEII